MWSMMGDSSFQADMSRQDLTELPESLFSRNTLQILDVHANKLTSLTSDVVKLTNLTVLVASHNLLTKLPKSIDKLSKLIILDVQNNRLTKLPKSIAKLKAVSKLFLNSNRLAQFPTAVVGMHELHTLNLSYNFIASVPSDLCRMRSLKMVRLAGNFIRTLPPEFWEFEQLEKVDVSNNLLTNIPTDLSRLKNVIELCIGYNKFTSFPEGLTTLPKVEVLSVECNNLTEIPQSITNLAPSLKKLHLMSNRLVDLPDHFRLLKNLDELDMRGNPLGQLGFGQGEWKKVLVELTSLKTLLTGAAPGQKAKVLIKPKENYGHLAPGGEEGKDEEHFQIPNGSLGRRARIKGVHSNGNGNIGLPSAAPPATEGNTFDMFRTMGHTETAKDELLKQLDDAAKGLQLTEPGKEKVDLESSGSDVASSTRLSVVSEDGDEEEFLRELEDNEVLPRDSSLLIQEYCAVEDLNKPGLQRAKKDAIQQEDAHCEHVPLGDKPEHALFCVFDGHGGKEASNAAIGLMPQQIMAHMKRLGEPQEDATELLHLAFMSVDNKMSQFEYEGCTATVVLVWRYGSDRYVQAANAGDSSAFMNCGNKVVALTRDHKLAYEEERERMTRTGVDVNEGQTRIGGGIAITRALGDHFAKDNESGMIAVPYISEAIKLTPDDTHLILASDGLWDVISGRRALDLVRTRPAAEAAAHLLKVALHNKECKDNVTVTVVRL